MKDFFKPTKAKILLTLFLPLYVGLVVEITENGTAVSAWRFTFFPYLALLFGAIAIWVGDEKFFSALANLSFGQTVWYLFLEVILPLLVNYLLACIIVYIYQKFWPVQDKADDPEITDDSLDL